MWPMQCGWGRIGKLERRRDDVREATGGQSNFTGPSDPSKALLHQVGKKPCQLFKKRKNTGLGF